MWNDPIVAEVRKAGEELSNESGGDIHVFFSNLRHIQKKYAERLTTKTPLKINQFKYGNHSLTALNCRK